MNQNNLPQENFGPKVAVFVILLLILTGGVYTAIKIYNEKSGQQQNKIQNNEHIFYDINIPENTTVNTGQAMDPEQIETRLDNFNLDSVDLELKQLDNLGI